VFRPGIDGVRIGERRFQMPDPLELPRVLGAVVPLVSAQFALIDELVALAFGHLAGGWRRFAPGRLPALAAVIRALDYLPEPAAGLRRVDAVRLHRRAFKVIHLPAREVRPVDCPIAALAIRSQDERAFLRADQYSNSAHGSLLF